MARTLDKKRFEKYKKNIRKGYGIEKSMNLAGYSPSYAHNNGLHSKNKKLAKYAESFRNEFDDRFTLNISRCTDGNAPELISELIVKLLNDPKLNAVGLASLLKTLRQYMKLNISENVSIKNQNNFFLPEKSVTFDDWSTIKKNAIEIESANSQKQDQNNIT